tara:strand:- start:3231 stop:4340 length:1110 start_codon:yes stop_codon:yes gene_type:complete
MPDATPALGLPYLLPNQAQKHVTHNEALAVLDVVVQLVLLAHDETTPPGSPDDGDSYGLSASPSGAWAGHGGEIASWRDGTWHFLVPQAGWRAWSAADAALLVFDGTAWQPPGFNPVALLGVNTSADTTNRFSVKSPASLFDHAGSDHNLKVNKAAGADTASLLFQTGYSGRAEFGTVGDDNFRIKVSPDGTAWTDALTIDKTTGRVGVRTSAPAFDLEVSGQIGCTATTPGLYLTETDQAIDERIWRVTGGGGNFFVQTLNDAGTIAQQGLVMTRDGTIIESIRLLTEGLMAIYAGVGQNVAIGHSAPTTRLHVNGPVRIGQYTKAALPAAASVGAGTVAYVSDASGGAQLAFSDGTDWRRASDRAVV